VTDYVYSKVAVYAELGGALRLARNARAFATDPVTGVPVNVTQGAFTAPYLDTDSSGIADFTATTLGPIRLTTGAVFVDVYSEELPATLAGKLDATVASSTYARPVVVMAGSGIDPTGATDSTTAMQAKLDSLPTSGGDVFIPAGVYSITGLTVSKTSHIVGAGGAMIAYGSSARAATTLVTTSATVTAMNVTAVGCVLQHFALVNEASGTPSAGVGILMASANEAIVNKVTVVGFYDNIQMLLGQYWEISQCKIYDPVRYGIYVNNGTTGLFDHGAWTVANNVFAPLLRAWGGSAAFRWESGGGGRIYGNQVNAIGTGHVTGSGSFAYGFDFAVIDNVSTGDFQITGNDINNVLTACIRLTTFSATPVAAGIQNVLITGNNLNAATAATGVLISTPAYNYYALVRRVYIVANQFIRLNQSIRANFAQHISIGHNFHQAITLACVSIGAGAGVYNAGVYQFSMERQTNPDDGVTMLTTTNSINNITAPAKGLTGRVIHDYQRQVGVTAVNTWETQYTIGVYPYKGAGRFKVIFSGYNGVTGPVMLEQSRSWITPTTNATPTLATIGTDIAVGAGVATIQYVLTSNQIVVQIQVPTGAADPSLVGLCQIELIGNVTSVLQA